MVAESCAAPRLLGAAQGQSLGHGLSGTGLGLCEGVGVDIEGGGHLGVSQGGGDGAHVCAAVDEQRGVQVSEVVDAQKALSGLLADD